MRSTLTPVTEQMIAAAHQLLTERVSGDYKARSEDPDDPQTVQAMQLAINLPKQEPPSRNQVLVDAARAAVARRARSVVPAL